MNIGIIGNYGATNIGDDAILESILKSHPEHNFTVFSANPDKIDKKSNLQVVKPLFPLGIRSFFKNGFRKPIKALKAVDVVIFGGGGLMQDSYLFACFLWAWQIFWVKFFNKPLFIYATGVGPLKTRIGRRLAKYVYNYAMGITCRDKKSKNILLSLKIPSESIEITADPVFLLQNIKNHTERKHNRYIISLRPWLKYNKKIISVFTEYLLQIKEERGAEFVFVCMQSIKERDHAVIDPIVKKVGGTMFIPQNFAELTKIMQEAEFAIGMRYHFLIATILTQTPALAISYSPKVDSLLKDSILEPYMLAVSDLSSAKLTDKLKRLSVDYNNVKVYQKRRCEDFKELARNNIGYFEGFIKSGN